MPMKTFLRLAMVMALAGVCQGASQRVMVLTGANNHDWRSTLPDLQAALKDVPQFQVTCFTTPSPDAPEAAWQTNSPTFANVDVVVMHWTDFGKKSTVRPWMNDLVSYVTNGGGLVIVHAAGLEVHPGWPAIAGLAWHDASFGDRIMVSNAGEKVRVPKGQGPGSGHGAPFSWEVTMRAVHPITTGVPPVWPHQVDELWHGTRGPAENMEIIATAYSPITKTNEPVMWTVMPGKGRVFVTLLGHQASAMKCPGFRHTLARGTEWAATGNVTLPVPADFPKASQKANN
jgi:uncharacterized protein